MVRDEPTRVSMLEKLCGASREASRNTAWQDFVNRYGPWIWERLMRHGVRPPDAEDVRQDALLVVFRAISKFHHNGRVGAFRRWLAEVLDNRLRVFERKERRLPAFVGSDIETLAQQLGDPESSLSRSFDRDLAKELLRDAIEVLKSRFPQASFEAIELVMLHGWKVDAVANKLGKTPGAIRTELCRDRKKLRDLCADSLQ